MARGGWTYLGILLGVAGSAPIFLSFGWDAWERLKAIYVSQKDVDRLAADCIAQFGCSAKQFIDTDLDRAKRRGETGEYWLLIRVRETIERWEVAGSVTQQ